MKYLKKIDNWLFKNITVLVMAWIKKKKYQEHKFDFALKIKGWEASWWIGIILWQGIQFFGRHRLVAGYINLFLVIFLMVFEMASYRYIEEHKESHDLRFANRKNPIVYQIEKEILEIIKERTEKERLKGIITVIALTSLVSVFAPLLLPIYGAAFIQLYIPIIFDFEEPSKKEKKEKDSVTDIVKNAWKQLIGGLAPGGT